MPFVEALVDLPVALVDVALQVEVLREDLSVLVDRSVDDGGLLRREELLVELELVREEEELRVEAPALHVLVEVFEVRVRLVWLEEWAQAVALLEPAHERRFSAPIVPATATYRFVMAEAIFWLRPLNMKPRMRTAGATTAPRVAPPRRDRACARASCRRSARAPSRKLSVKRMLPTARAILPLLDEEAAVAREAGHHGARAARAGRSRSGGGRRRGRGRCRR